MGPDEVKAWSDAVGPTLIAVIALVLVVIPMIRRSRSEGHETAADVQVDIAIIKERCGQHGKDIADLQSRMAAMETPKSRTRS